MPRVYRPILRSKAGEAIALRNLSVAVKERTIPLVVLLPEPAATFPGVAGEAWNGFPLALDGRLSVEGTGDDAAYADMFQQLGQAGVEVIPAISMRAPAVYIAAVQKTVNQFGDGLVAKARLNDIAGMVGWLAEQGWEPQIADLVITLGDISGYPMDVFEQLVVNGISAHLQAGHPWRSVTIAASSAPKDHSGLNLGRNDVPRLEWALWRAVAPQLPFELDYGDTGQVHPSLDEPPGFAMARATVSVRYSTADHWIILKGRPTTGATGQPMSAQYRAHAQTLVNDQQFDQLLNCWGDDEISAIANGRPQTGNRTNWASFSMNRHISLNVALLP